MPRRHLRLPVVTFALDANERLKKGGRSRLYSNIRSRVQVARLGSARAMRDDRVAIGHTLGIIVRKAVGRWVLGGVSAAVPAFALLVSCAWDYATVDDVDTGPRPDTGPGTVKLADGRVCTDHDEDGDGLQDDCDNCPSVANPTQAAPAGSPIGTACAPRGVTVATRVEFDAFTGPPFAWISVPGSALVPADDVLRIGSTSDTTFRFATRASPRIVAVLGVVAFDVAGGRAGVLARVGDVAGGGTAFLGCSVQLGGTLSAIRSPPGGCNGGICAATVLPGADGDAGAGDAGATVSYPSDLPSKPGAKLGLALMVADSGGSTSVTCRVFDPGNPASLSSTDPRAVTTGTAVGPPTGTGLGIFAENAKVTFHSLDMLK